MAAAVERFFSARQTYYDHERLFRHWCARQPPAAKAPLNCFATIVPCRRVHLLIASARLAANTDNACRTKKKGGSPSSKPPARTKFASGSIAAPACSRRQNFTRRSVGCRAKHERANFAKKRFAATFGGLYALLLGVVALAGTWFGR